MLKKYILKSYRKCLYLDDIKKLQAKTKKETHKKSNKQKSFYNYDTSFDFGTKHDVITGYERDRHSQE